MLRLLVLVVALAFVPSASAKLPDACKLLTTAQVVKALGTEVDHRTPGGSGVYRTCTWHGRPLAGASPSQPQLVVSVVELTRAGFRKRQRQTEETVTVRGVGELAYWHDEPPFLAVWHDGYALTVTAAQVPAPLVEAKRLARAALARL